MDTGVVADESQPADESKKVRPLTVNVQDGEDYWYTVYLVRVGRLGLKDD